MNIAWISVPLDFVYSETSLSRVVIGHIHHIYKKALTGGELALGEEHRAGDMLVVPMTTRHFNEGSNMASGKGRNTDTGLVVSKSTAPIIDLDGLETTGNTTAGKCTSDSAMLKDGQNGIATSNMNDRESVTGMPAGCRCLTDPKYKH